MKALFACIISALIMVSCGDVDVATTSPEITFLMEDEMLLYYDNTPVSYQISIIAPYGRNYHGKVTLSPQADTIPFKYNIDYLSPDVMFAKEGLDYNLPTTELYINGTDSLNTFPIEVLSHSRKSLLRLELTFELEGINYPVHEVVYLYFGPRASSIETMRTKKSAVVPPDEGNGGDGEGGEDGNNGEEGGEDGNGDDGEDNEGIEGPENPEGGNGQ